MAANNGGKRTFDTVANDFAYILQAENFVHTVPTCIASVINVFLCLMQKFKMVENKWRGNDFGKKCHMTLSIS